MATIQELLDAVSEKLDPNVDYKAKLLFGGYRTPDAVRQDDNAEKFQEACKLPRGEALAIWKAAGAVAGRQLAVLTLSNIG